AVGEHEGPLELARGDAAMEIGALGVLALAAPDDQLVVLDGDFQLFEAETGHRQGDHELVTSGVVGHALDVVRGVAVTRNLGGTVEQTLKPVKAQQERTVEMRYPRHVMALVASGDARGGLVPASRPRPSQAPGRYNVQYG